MMNETEWKDFVARARRDGKLIENVIKDVYVSNIDRAGNALDGGAHVGFHTIGLALHLTRGKVLAVEANAATFKTLQSNTRRFDNVVLSYAALQDGPERPTVTFNCSTSHPGRSGIGRLWDRIAPGEVQYEASATVPATTIDKLVCDNVPSRLDLIKLDLEGGEYHALQGGEATLRRLRPLVVSEHSVHAPVLNGFAIGDYFTWLQSLNYTPLSPGGERVDLNRPFPFWYVFLVPTERLDDWSSRIATSLDKFQ